MKPLEFLEPKTLEEACSLLSKHKEAAKLIAGGQSLRPIMRHRLIAPKYLINLKGLSELDYIKELSGELRIGAITTHRTVETSTVINQKFPILAEMERSLGSVQIRNWGTIGGSLAHADPSGDPAPVLIAIGAKVKVVSTKDERELPLENFLTGYYETALESDEILKEITIPYLPPNSGSAYLKEVIRAGDIGIATVAAIITLNSKQEVKEAKFVLGAQGTPPIRATQAERAATGKRVGDSTEDVAEAAAKEARPQTDILGSVEYKLDMVKSLIKRAISLSITRAHAD
ncbi:FAD binding domain-containing protein [Chloroflexota bacterium]